MLWPAFIAYTTAELTSLQGIAPTKNAEGHKRRYEAERRNEGYANPLHDVYWRGVRSDASLVACCPTANYNRTGIGNVGELHNLEDEPWPRLKAKVLTLKN